MKQNVAHDHIRDAAGIDDAITSPPRATRRSLLRLAAAAAAGGAVAAVSSGNAEVANGDYVVLGANNLGTQTAFRSDADKTHAVLIVDHSPIGTGNGIESTSKGSGNSGVLGRATDGNGVRGVDTGPDGTGREGPGTARRRRVGFVGPGREVRGALRRRVHPDCDRRARPRQEVGDDPGVHGGQRPAQPRRRTHEGRDRTGLRRQHVGVRGPRHSRHLATAGWPFHRWCAPKRVFDSRWAGFGPTLTTGSARTVNVADGRTLAGEIDLTNLVPAGATAIQFTLTCTNTVARGFLAATPGGTTTYSASSINWTGASQVIANTTMTTVDAARNIKLYCGGSGASTDAIVDIVGYFL